MSFDNGFKADEEKWLVIISSSHSLFCGCEDLNGHLNRLFRWRSTDDSGCPEEPTEGGGGHTGELTDLDLLAAMAEESASAGDTGKEG